MKKYILLVICIISLNSCATLTTTTTTLVGDITTYNSEGNELQKWKGVTIEEKVSSYGSTTTISDAVKSWGLNFYDKEKDCYVILSNAVPYKVEYKVNKTTKVIEEEPEPKTEYKYKKGEYREFGTY